MFAADPQQTAGEAGSLNGRSASVANEIFVDNGARQADRSGRLAAIRSKKGRPDRAPFYVKILSGEN